jgi:hypothetical protein
MAKRGKQKKERTKRETAGMTADPPYCTKKTKKAQEGFFTPAARFCPLKKSLLWATFDL